MTSNKGNKKLTYPVGLITGDEVALAGSGNIYNETISIYYLRTGKEFWTITPADFEGDGGMVLTEGYYGNLVYYDMGNTAAVRPVISLSFYTNFIGNGTMSDPFRIED